jgi:RNase adaptor protein for sRNA GlmZ degradation
MTCILISGEIGAGKSSVARLLASELVGEVVSARLALEEVLSLDSPDRRTLQELGARLDRRTKGRWLYEYLAERSEQGRSLVVDSLRTKRQTLPILENMPDSRLIYLDAGRGVRTKRFDLSARSDAVKRSMSFDLASKHPTERSVHDLRPLAHIVIETDDLDLPTTVREIRSRLTGM